MPTNTKHRDGQPATSTASGTTDVQPATSAPTPARRRRRLRVPELTYSVLVFIALLALWQLAVKVFDVSDILVPAPSAVASSVVEGFQDGSLVTHSVVTLKEIVIGFGLAGASP